MQLAGALSAKEQPAFRSGKTTFFEGLRILAVSAIKCTPAKTIISAFVFAACCAKPKAVADIISHILDIRLLVIMRQHNSILFFFQQFNFMKQISEASMSISKKPFSNNFSIHLMLISAIIYVLKYLFIKKPITITGVNMVKT